MIPLTLRQVRRVLEVQLKGGDVGSAQAVTPMTVDPEKTETRVGAGSLATNLEFNYL